MELKLLVLLKAKETILVWTDNALYTMKFIGAPFTFGFEQVGTNCGLIGKNAAVEIDGNAFWMSANGLFLCLMVQLNLYRVLLKIMFMIKFRYNKRSTSIQQVLITYLQKLFGIILQLGF